MNKLSNKEINAEIAENDETILSIIEAGKEVEYKRLKAEAQEKTSIEHINRDADHENETFCRISIKNDQGEVTDVVEISEEFLQGRIKEDNLLYVDSSLVVYDSTDCYQTDNITCKFKDSETNTWIDSREDIRIGDRYSEGLPISEIYDIVEGIKSSGHLMGRDYKIYHRDEAGKTIDTGFSRDFGGSHLDSFGIFKDSFTAMERPYSKSEMFDGDPYSKENIWQNILYKRQKNGQYEEILRTNGEAIFQPEASKGFPDNVYFVGGTIRSPQPIEYFVDGEVSSAVKEKLDELFPDKKARLEQLSAYRKGVQEKLSKKNTPEKEGEVKKTKINTGLAREAKGTKSL